MSEYKHATDRTKMVLIAECLNGHQGVEVDCSGKEEQVGIIAEKVEEIYDTCGDCGAEMGLIQQQEPVEVLE
jgi:hypothetical protein